MFIMDFQIGWDIKLDPRPEYHRSVITWTQGEDLPTAEGTGNQISSRLLSLKAANALLVLPPKSADLTNLKKDDKVDAIIIGRI